MTAYAVLGRFQETASITNLTSVDEESIYPLLGQIIGEVGRKTDEILFLINRRDRLTREWKMPFRRFGLREAWHWNVVVRDLREERAVPLPDLDSWHMTGLWTEGFSI
jgi:hypothetical protein